jgi:hypothetical protein
MNSNLLCSHSVAKRKTNAVTRPPINKPRKPGKPYTEVLNIAYSPASRTSAEAADKTVLLQAKRAIISITAVYQKL